MKQNETIRISLIGDIFPGELTYTQNYGIRTQFEMNKGLPWKGKIREIIGENDLAIGNLESPLLEKADSIKKTFFGEPEFPFFLKQCGINFINIANNHILEHGKLGFSHTIQVLEKAKFGVVGYMKDSKSNIVYEDVKGLKIAIAGFSNVDLQLIQNDGHFAILNEDNVLNTLREMEQQSADLKILCFHWGNEYVHIPSLEQRKMAYKFIDNGADIIAGHHPHVIQPYEKYKNGHIFYSLGNFMFDYIHSKMFSIGLAVNLVISENKQIHTNMSGVKLSYIDTINLLPAIKFEKYYSNVIKLYDKFCMLTDEDYQKCYHTLRKRNRLQQRILMKTSIIREFLRIRKEDKIWLIRNFSKYYLSFLKNVVRKKITV